MSHDLNERVDVPALIKKLRKLRPVYEVASRIYYETLAAPGENGPSWLEPLRQALFGGSPPDTDDDDGWNAGTLANAVNRAVQDPLGASAKWTNEAHVAKHCHVSPTCGERGTAGLCACNCDGCTAILRVEQHSNEKGPQRATAEEEHAALVAIGDLMMNTGLDHEWNPSAIVEAVRFLANQKDPDAIRSDKAIGISEEKLQELLDAVEAVVQDDELDLSDVDSPAKAKEAQLELIAHIRDQIPWTTAPCSDSPDGADGVPSTAQVVGDLARPDPEPALWTESHRAAQAWLAKELGRERAMDGDLVDALATLLEGKRAAL